MRIFGKVVALGSHSCVTWYMLHHYGWLAVLLYILGAISSAYWFNAK